MLHSILWAVWSLRGFLGLLCTDSTNLPRSEDRCFPRLSLGEIVEERGFSFIFWAVIVLSVVFAAIVLWTDF
jgi:hypothetical protein